MRNQQGSSTSNRSSPSARTGFPLHQQEQQQQSQQYESQSFSTTKSYGASTSQSPPMPNRLIQLTQSPPIIPPAIERRGSRSSSPISPPPPPPMLLASMREKEDTRLDIADKLLAFRAVIDAPGPQHHHKQEQRSVIPLPYSIQTTSSSVSSSAQQHSHPLLVSDRETVNVSHAQQQQYTSTSSSAVGASRRYMRPLTATTSNSSSHMDPHSYSSSDSDSREGMEDQEAELFTQNHQYSQYGGLQDDQQTAGFHQKHHISPKHGPSSLPNKRNSHPDLSTSRAVSRRGSTSFSPPPAQEHHSAKRKRSNSQPTPGTEVKKKKSRADRDKQITNDPCVICGQLCPKRCYQAHHYLEEYKAVFPTYDGTLGKVCPGCYYKCYAYRQSRTRKGSVSSSASSASSSGSSHPLVAYQQAASGQWSSNSAPQASNLQQRTIPESGSHQPDLGVSQHVENAPKQDRSQMEEVQERSGQSVPSDDESHSKRATENLIRQLRSTLEEKELVIQFLRQEINTTRSRLDEVLAKQYSSPPNDTS